MSDQQDVDTGNEQAQDFFQSDQFDDVVSQQTETHDFPDDFDDLPPEDRSDDTAGDDLLPDDDSDDTDSPFEDPDFDDEDSDEDDDEDDDEEDEEDEAEEGEEDDEDEDQEDFTSDQPLTKKDREAIAKNPELKRAYGSMQRRFTKGMQGMSQREAEVVEREKFAQNVQETVADPKLFAGMMKKVMEGDPRIAEAAFNAVTDGDQRENFLLEVALKHRDTFEKVRGRFEELTGDEDALKKYEETIALQGERRQVQEERVQLNRRRYQQERAKLTSHAKRVARQMGIGKEDMFLVEEHLDREIRAKVRKKDGSIALETADVKTIVQGANSELERVYRRIAKRQSKSKTETSQQKAKTRAKTAKRGRKARTPSQRTKGKATDKRRATRSTNRGATQRERDHDLMSNIGESARQAGIASRR